MRKIFILLFLTLFSVGQKAMADKQLTIVCSSVFNFSENKPYFKNGAYDNEGSASDWNAYYNAGENVLYIKNLECYYLRAYDMGDLTIKVMGDNKIKCSVSDGVYFYAVSTNNTNLKIVLGDNAHLSVETLGTGLSWGVNCDNGSLEITTEDNCVGSVDIDVKTTHVSQQAVGIETDDVFTVSGNANIDVKVHNYECINFACRNDKGIVLDTSGNVTFDASDNRTGSYALLSENVVVKNAETITLKAHIHSVYGGGLNWYNSNSLADDMSMYGLENYDTGEVRTWIYKKYKQYGLEVGGVPVTDANCANITGSNIKAGTATYDDETKTLTLTNCTISMDNATGTIGIKSTKDSLAIHLVGNNIIRYVEIGIEGSGDVTIVGPGKMLLAVCNTGIYMTEISQNDLAITDGAKLDMELVNTGILGKTLKAVAAGTTKVLYRKNLRVSGGMTDVSIIASTSAITDMNKIVLNDGLSLTAPVGAKFENHTVKDKDGNVVNGNAMRISLAGDVNHDGVITMADANAVVNYFLATDKPSDFDVDNANVNGDYDDNDNPTISMADANGIVNMFLKQ